MVFDDGFTVSDDLSVLPSLSMASLPANRPTASVYVAEPVRRRSAFPLALAITSCSALAFGRVSVGYRASHIRVRGKKAPVSFWYPATPGRVSKELPYRHFISVAKIVEVLQGTELPGIGWEFRLRAGKPIYPEAQPIPVERQETELQERRLAEGLPRESCAIIFAHGYLGSRFDMLHLCEELAQCGFVVAAPDFAESLSGKVPLREVTRQDIMEELLTRLQKEFAVKHFGIVGHSAGGGTASLFPGPFQCGRVAIAGLAPQTVPTDPLLVVASEGDGVVALPRITAALPKNIELQDMDQFDAARPAIAILLRENGTRPPCHISFLSEESNKAMISLLTPLLPVARALKVPVLDFDVYLELQDSSRVAKVLLPKIEDFLCFHASKAK